MQTFYNAKVSMPNGPLALERTFHFASADDRDRFLNTVQGTGVKLICYGLDHIVTPSEAVAEVQREMEPL